MDFIIRRHILAGLMVIVIACQAWAATFVVDSPLDRHDVLPGDGLAADHLDSDSAHTTLRAALEEANALPGPDTIQVPSGLGTIVLSLGWLTISNNGTILTGLGTYPILDGIGNPLNHPILSVLSDSNQVSGLILRRSRGDGILISGRDNLIGGTSVDDRMLLIENGLDNPESGAIRIAGREATRNTIAGSYIGLAEGGMTSAPNRHGVIIEAGAFDNLVGSLLPEGRNLISGNEGYGVLLTGQVTDNQVAGNWIGPDSSGFSGPGNQRGGILLTDEATSNLIGADSIPFGNVISANPGHGIELSGPKTASNMINANLIGCDESGRNFLANERDGLHLADGTHHNTLGGITPAAGNLISGNSGNGICLTGEGVSNNLIGGNWIGIGLTGSHYLGNGWISGDGILLEYGPTNNIIGDTSFAGRNVCSANYGFGIHLRGEATSNNQIIGNYVGLNAPGTSSLGNVAGVVIADGAQSNTVGGIDAHYRNVISSNRGGDFPYGVGVLIYGVGTNFNYVSANYIGLNAAGETARGNLYAGVVLGAGAQYNTIGGSNLSDGNTISGNGLYDPNSGRAAGIHLFGTNTDFNTIRSNLIGVDPTSQVAIPNGGHGIGLYSGSSHNEIGGDIFRHANYITHNEGAGIYLDGEETRANTIRQNRINQNDGPGIELTHDAQDNIWPPTLTQVGRLLAPGSRLVSGNGAPSSAEIDIYEVYDTDLSGAGEGARYMATTIANANGIFEFYLPYDVARPITLTATSVDADGNTSAFSVNRSSPDVTDVESDPELLPLEFNLAQNYPNPFNMNTRLSFDIPRRSNVKLEILNLLGQRVITLVNGPLPRGHYSVDWDGKGDGGHEVASGHYFYRLRTDNNSSTRKMILLK